MFAKSDLVYIISLFILMLIPNRIEQSAFVKIQQPMSVVTHKNYPPYLAHVEVNKKNRIEADAVRAMRTFQLSTADFSAHVAKTSSMDSQHFVLNEIKLSKSELTKYEPKREPQRPVRQPQIPEDPIDDQSWVQNLPRMQRIRVELAQQKSDILNTETKAAFSQTGAFQPSRSPAKKVTPEQQIVWPNAKPEFKAPPIAQNDYKPPGDEEFQPKPRGIDLPGINLKGSIEILGGLAITNEHSIEIRHVQQGVAQESGQVNLVDGTYKIQITDPGGFIQARLMNREGEILGDGQFQVTNLNAADDDSTEIRGPKLVLMPKKALTGSFYSQYAVGSRASSIENANALFFHGTEDAKINTDQRVQENRLGRGSQTLMTIESKKYEISQKIVTSGDEFEMPLMPLKMASSLRQIVSDFRQQDLTNPEGSLIWGQVKIEGKPLAGVTVEIESAQEIEAVYFNEFFLPDPNLKSTSSNGYYAFLEAQPGFHSLVAKRGDKYFAHDNVIVENATVTLSELKSTVSSKIAQVKTFDAFNGEPRDISLEIQSTEQALETRNGVASLSLPNIHRLSIAKVPYSNGYAAGIYQYDDANDFIHIPLINEEWLVALRRNLKLDDAPYDGTVIGFVNDENFEVYTAVEDSKIVKIYFDAQGNISTGKSGVMGGGFILFNVPQGTNEAIVYGLRTEKFYSQIIPVDPNSLNVLSYRSE